MWWGLFIGVVVGALLGEWAGAVVCGFLGWLVGLVVSSHNKSKKQPIDMGLPAAEPPPPSDRVAMLEMRVAALEERLARLSGMSTGPEAAPYVVEPEPVTPPDVPPVVPVLHVVPEPVEPEVPQPPPKPSEPNPIIGWITGGNAFARVGVIVLFIGLAFLLRYAVEHSLVPPELRIAGIGAVGIVLLVFGYRLRSSKPGYALSLQGAGVGVLYLTVFGALRLYGLIPPEIAFPLLVVIAALATWLAVRQDSLALAAFGAAGGFIAPVLASTGRGDHVMLFGYFAVLNLAILATAWFKSWRPLNLLGFAFTFVIGLLWGEKYYRPEHLDTVEPFLVFFFLLYVAVAVLFARREAASKAERIVDGTLVFGVPLVGFGMQAGLMQGIEYGLAFSSLALAAFYLVLAALIKDRASYRLLTQAFLALGIVFATLAIPLALDARWTSAAWAVEGAAVLWMGARQGRKLPQAFGALLQVAGGVAFVLGAWSIEATYPIANGLFLGCFLVAAAGMLSHRALRATAPEGRAMKLVVSAFFLWSLAWLLAAVHHDLERFLSNAHSLNAHIALAATITLAFAALHRRGEWREAAWPAAALLPVLGALAIVSLFDLTHPFARFGWLAWPLALIGHLWARRLVEDPARESGGWGALQHAGTLVLAAFLGAFELHWLTREAGLVHTAWSAASLVVAPALLLMMVSARSLEERWPIARHLRAYRVLGASALVSVMTGWIIVANANRPGSSDPLPYLPLLNAIDLGHALIAIALLAWWKALGRAPGRPPFLEARGGWMLIGAAAFVWANGVLLRSLHHWAGVPYDIDDWLRSFIVQAAISIFWSVLALGLMVFATRRGLRTLWMVGAALMTVVVVKLALVDFANLAGLERIVSFIGVGVLMLVIGYFSPLPPAREPAP